MTQQRRFAGIEICNEVLDELHAAGRTDDAIADSALDAQLRVSRLTRQQRVD